LKRTHLVAGIFIILAFSFLARTQVPQGVAIFELEFFVYNDLQTIKVGSRQLDCRVIGESFLELTFYFFDNELVPMRNEEQDTLLEKRIY
jgi:hypothetical protein